MTLISSIGILTSQTSNLQNEQVALATLNQELASGQVHSNLTDYSSTNVGQLLNFQNVITQKQGYLASMQNVSTRLSVYDNTMTDMESVAKTAQLLATQNQNYDPTQLGSLQAEATNFLKQITSDLNQQVGSRYIFSGIRYSTPPVVDLSTLSGTPSTTTVSSPTLPVYDTQFVNSGITTNANAYTKDTLTVDTGYNVTYGITSTDPAFQNLIAGIRYISQATKEVTASAYQADMTNATSLLSTAVTGMQTLHASNAYNQNTLTTETSTLNAEITNFQNQVSDIQQVDTTQVATSITFLTTQLQASYSATASLINLSLLKYL